MTPPATSTLSELAQAILEQALSPEEWVGYRSKPDASEASVTAAKLLVEKWKKLIVLRSGAVGVFHERLKALGLVEASAHLRFLHRSIEGDFTPPAWAVLLERVQSISPAECVRTLEFLGSETDEEVRAYDIKPTETPAFRELLAPFVVTYLSSIQDACEVQLTLAAQASLGRTLVRRLSALCARTAAFERKSARLRGALGYEVWGSADARQELLRKYPVLARLLATVTAYAIDVTVEVLDRLSSDRADICRTLLGDVDPGKVDLCFAGLSDMHDGGHSAWRLRFESGANVIYKPRSHEIDVLYGSLITWLNGKGDGIGLRAAKALSKEGYGWTEFIESRECSSAEQVARYYRRQGAHAALIYFLCGQDFHGDNFIADGETPVAIDLEGLLSPSIAVASGDFQAIPQALRSLQFSVASSLMLPYWRSGDFERPLFQASGIGGTGEHSWPVKQPVWKGADTGFLTLQYEYQDFSFDASVPRLAGAKATAQAYLDDVTTGFADAYRVWMEYRDPLLGPESPLEAWRHLRSRLLFRDTQDYSNLLFWTTAPDLLESGAAYDIALESLTGSIPVFFNGSAYPEIVEEEKRSLWQRDIPIAYAHASETGIFFASGAKFGPIVPVPIFDQMQQRIAEASETDLDWQCSLIRSLLQMAAEPVIQVRSRSAQPADDAPSRRMLAFAHSLGEDLDRIAMKHGDAADWLALMRFAGAGSRVQPAQWDPWSLNGSAGHALFLTNLSVATGEKRFETLTRKALASAFSTHQTVARGPFAHLMATSGYYGTFALVYALAASGFQLGDEELIQKAIDLALEQPVEKLSNETNPDFLTGAAGPLTILCHLHHQTGDARLLKPALALGEAISRCAVDKGRQGWKVPAFHRPLLGMAHGSAGIAVALLKLYQETGDPRWRDSALAGLAHEREHFQAADGAWPNLQEPSGRVSYMTGWCAGAPGIGLSRLVVQSIVPEEAESAAEIETAILATRRVLGGQQQHFCCGEAGRIMFLAEAGHVLDRPALHSEALEAAGNMLDRYEQKKVWYLQDFCEKLTVPGLLGGVPGIGMSLLGLARPSISKVYLLS